MSTENGRFAGKLAFITGAGSGIGQATAIAFAREGASVAAADLTEQHSQATVDGIIELGGDVLAIGCDVTNSEQVQAALRQTVDEFGHIDVAFNNAGVEHPPDDVFTIAPPPRSMSTSLMESNAAEGEHLWEIAHLQVTSPASNGAIATIRWVARRPDNSVLWEFEDTYVLGDSGGGWQILGDIVHDDR